MKKYLRELGKIGITIRSAGIRASDGYPPTDETVDVLKEEGAAPDDFKSSALTDEMIRASDLILVMEEMHKNEVVKRVPGAASKTFLLKEYGRAGDDKITDPSIPDPIGQPITDYKNCLEMIKKETERVAKLL